MYRDVKEHRQGCHHSKRPTPFPAPQGCNDGAARSLRFTDGNSCFTVILSSAHRVALSSFSSILSSHQKMAATPVRGSAAATWQTCTTHATRRFTARAPCRPAWLLTPSRRLPAPPPHAASDDAEVAVFRFTLGNDALDALVPRVAGVAGATLLLLNHFLANDAPSDAQASCRRLGASAYMHFAVCCSCLV